MDKIIDKGIEKTAEETPAVIYAKNKNINEDDETISEAIFAKLAEVEERLKAIDEKMSKPLID